MENSDSKSSAYVPQKTALYEAHKKAQGQIVDFSGWLLPIRYTSITKEHKQVRNHVGLFDVSHMGDIRIKGSQALETLQWLTSNDVSELTAGRAQYNLFISKDGYIVDDLIIYCLEQNNDYLLCVNASNTQKDFDWISKNNKGANLVNESDKWSLLALQGPKASALLSQVFKQKDWCNTNTFDVYLLDFQGSEIIVARTGYTGEWGVEIFIANHKALALWEILEKKGAQPTGLGARDTLRLEMKFSLYGHEIDENTHPYEAGLGWVVKANKKDFLGKKALARLAEAQKTNPQRKLVGFKLLDRAIPRQGYKCLDNAGQEIGLVTSGTMSPTLGEGVGIGYVKPEHSKIGSEFLLSIRGRQTRAIVVKTPFINL